MKSRGLFACLVVSALLLCAVPLHAQGGILRLRIDDPITPYTEELVKRAVAQADREHDDVLLIELNTPGGLLESNRVIVEQILSSPVPVVAWVGPAGARAASAGFLILEAADVASMATGTNTGASHPVDITGGKMDDVMKTKIENDTAASLRSYVTKRGRNPQLAEKAVRESVSWTESEALKEHLIDLVADDEAALLRTLDGRQVTRFNGSVAVLHTAGKTVHDLPISPRLHLLGWLMNPSIVFLLLAIGALCLYAEFSHPGAIIPGVAGAIAILLAIFALNMLPTRFEAVALIVLAFVLFALEAKLTSHGVLTVGGIISLTLGGLLLIDSPIPELRVHLWTSLAISVPLGLITAFLMTLVVRARRNKITTGAQGLVGELGVARTQLAPSGKVFIHGELWDARSAVPLAAGSEVRVTRVNGLALEVEAADRVKSF